MQQQKDRAARFQQGYKESKQDDATEEEKRSAAEFGITVAEYRRQQQNYVDAAKQGKDDRKVHVADDPKNRNVNNEERFAAGGGMMGGDQGGGEGLNELTDTIKAVKLAGPEAVGKERVKQEERALAEMKSQYQRQQKNHEQQHGQYENYQVIEVEIEESVVEDYYVQISPYVSSYEQDINERGRGGNNQQQQPNLTAMAEGMRVQPPQQSPRAQHLNEGETASLPSLNDGTRNHNSPHYDPSHRHDYNHHHQSHDGQDHHHYNYHDNQRYNQDPNRDRQNWSHHDPPGHYDHRDHSHHPPDPSYPRNSPPGPPLDPHHQFTIGSMVCVDVQKGDPLYGVVKWIGTVPDYPGTIAGVELVCDHVTLCIS